MKRHKLAKGLFISFEGGEGVGKTTQLQLLADTLKKQGYPVRVFREPGGIKISEAIRAITHDPTNTMMDYRAEALLLAASRAQLVTEAYKPLLAKNYIVIADRYVDSSYAYQGYGRGIGYQEIKLLNDFAINGLLPDVTFLLDLDYNEGQRRRHNTLKVDRMDMQKKQFYKTVHEAYHEIAKKHRNRIITIDADRDIQSIHKTIWDLVEERLTVIE
jgi:dTMP kinase